MEVLVNMPKLMTTSFLNPRERANIELLLSTELRRALGKRAASASNLSEDSWEQVKSEVWQKTQEQTAKHQKSGLSLKQKKVWRGILG